MKKFNLEEALDGKPVVTRDGRKVTHITKIPNHNFIVGIIEDIKQITQWSVNGNFLNDHSTHPCDLFMFVEKKSVWVNVYEDSTGSLWAQSCVSKEVADRLKSTSEKFNKYIKTIEITNEI